MPHPLTGGPGGSRNAALRQLTTVPRTPRPEHSAFTLPDFAVPVR
jgi:hypothetical protein